MGVNGGPSGTALVYIGTYTQTLPHVQGKAEGIYIYQMDRLTGRLNYLSTTAGVTNPSFLAVAPQAGYLYAVEEVEQVEGQAGGRVAAFKIGSGGQTLELINHQPTHGAFPCYVSIDRSGRWLLVANHGGGSVSVLPILADGSLGPATATVQHRGSSGTAPHPHSIIASPDNRYVLVADAGLDRIIVYQLDPEHGALVEREAALAKLPPGTGPRHLQFHPDGSYLYSINERASTITAWEYDQGAGGLREIQTISTLPQDFTGRNARADIHIAASGHFLYGSNRGHDSIASFAVDPATGKLRASGHTPTSGRVPRNFALDPSGALLLAANQNTDSAVTFAVDREEGGLTALDQIASVPTPVCLCLVDEGIWLPG